jgi:hypothetical protein
MIIDEKNTDLKRLTGRLKLRFLTETVVGKEMLKFGSIFGSFPDFPSLHP